jgi:2-phospho-L-lactate transferase/gluconeogenesis factor (CofD/UPF0052 family)
VLGDEPIYQLMKRLMDEVLGLGTSILDILERYPELIDTLIIDKSTKHYNDHFEKIGMEVLITTTRLLSQENRKKVAKIFSKGF